MAERPWAVPVDVVSYSDYKQVQERAEEKLCVDISRAEQYVIAYTNNDFSDVEVIPESVKTAVILLAEAYAYNACADPKSGGRRLKSESFDDYSYSADNAYISIDDIGVKVLLDPYVKAMPRNGITMRMRKL